MEQLPLQFTSYVNFDVENYIVTASNQEAFNWVNKWPDWDSNSTCIFGEKGSGKTYLTKIWQKKSKAVLITPQMMIEQSYFEGTATAYILEDLEDLVEQKQELFCFLNYILQSKKFLLITSESKPMEIDFGLQDIQSRLNSIFTIAIKKPNEDMVGQILVKYFSDRQIIVDGGVINYLMHHMDRSYTTIANVVNSLDKYALMHHRKISIPLVKEVCGI